MTFSDLVELHRNYFAGLKREQWGSKIRDTSVFIWGATPVHTTTHPSLTEEQKKILANSGWVIADEMGNNVAGVCPDCKGSGKYHGFSVIEDCQTCKGSGQG